MYKKCDSVKLLTCHNGRMTWMTYMCQLAKIAVILQFLTSTQFTFTNILCFVILDS